MTATNQQRDERPRRITEVTRRRIIDGLFKIQRNWSGTLEDADFLGRLYDLDQLPSHDSRYTTAAQDICQHTWRNNDWDDDWIFHDTRFGIVNQDDKLLRFLAEMLHPYVRTDLGEVRQLLEFFNGVLVHDGYELIQIDAISGAPVFGYRLIGSGVPGALKNLIFAAIGPKPDIVLDDALNNDLRIVRHEQNCLVYDRALAAHGLTWRELTDWWADRQGLTDKSDRDISLSLYRRLDSSLGDNDAERRILRTYTDRYVRLGPDIPALLPQVYLHYDPYTAKERRAPGPLARQRMDFLLLLPHRARVVIECDGIQHYADKDHDWRADPHRYAAMMAEDRDLRLKGYEVYRFGRVELTEERAASRLLNTFFDRLDQRYRK